MIMSNRELVIDLVNKLPADTPLAEIIEKLEFIAGVRVGREQAKRRQGVSIDEARRLIREWTSESS